MCEDLPIMPLNAVLFPGAPSTLYLHEQRYKEMLDEVVDGQGYFGVALLKAGKEVGGPGIPHDVGTIAQIAEVTRLPDGSAMVLARGGPRFRIDAILSTIPVVRADVRLLEERNDVPPGEMPLVETARNELRMLMELVLRTMGADDAAPEVPEDPVGLSYAIAANLQTTLAVQQRLLESDSFADRLDIAMPILRQEVGHYRVLAAARSKLEALGFAEDDERPFSRN